MTTNLSGRRRRNCSPEDEEKQKSDKLVGAPATRSLRGWSMWRSGRTTGCRWTEVDGNGRRAARFVLTSCTTRERTCALGYGCTAVEASDAGTTEQWQRPAARWCGMGGLALQPRAALEYTSHARATAAARGQTVQRRGDRQREAVEAEARHAVVERRRETDM
jgi:hypothetical protein